MRNPPAPHLQHAPSSIARRDFLRHSVVASLAASAFSFEEQNLNARARDSSSAASPGSPAKIPMGKIGKVRISRIICGGNLISGYAHSRDLIYVSDLLKNYFTHQKIMETWELCEEHGINTMIVYPNDKNAGEAYRKYGRDYGGSIQYLAQIAPGEKDLKTEVLQARDMGAAGAFLVGNLGDQWTREGKTQLIAELISLIKEQGMIAGVAGHELRTPKSVEQAGGNPDFYVKTLHSADYWSTRRPDQRQEVIDNYAVDNYWCMDPDETIQFMAKIQRPWIAYKVLAAGAIHPRQGFKFAFENGADFAAVGMFDFQVAENALVAREVLSKTVERKRAWMA